MKGTRVSRLTNSANRIPTCLCSQRRIATAASPVARPAPMKRGRLMAEWAATESTQHQHIGTDGSATSSPPRRSRPASAKPTPKEKRIWAKGKTPSRAVGTREKSQKGAIHGTTKP